MRRHLKILDFALASLQRRPIKNWAIIAVYAFTVAVVASVLFRPSPSGGKRPNSLSEHRN